MRPLGDILTDIVNGVTISDDDKDGLRLLGNQLQNVSSSVSGWTQGDPGQISNVSFLAGGSNVLIDALGIRIYDPPLLTGWWEIDGDLKSGSNITSPDTTSFSIFSNAQTYNGEAMGAGDVLFGSNSSGYANLLWDLSAKTFYFRGGTTPQVSITTTGQVTAGGGAVLLDSDGISIIEGAASTNSIKWIDSFGWQSAWLQTIVYDGPPTQRTLSLTCNASATRSVSQVLITTGNGSGGHLARAVFNSSYNGDLTDEIQLQVNATSMFMIDGSGFYIIPASSYGSYTGPKINEISADGTLAGNSDTALPTEKAVKTYADTKQTADATLTSLAALGTAADKMAYTTAADTWAEASITAAGRAILDDANAAAQLATLGAIADAPSDGTTYGRNNAAWVAAGGGGGDKYPCEARLTLETGVPVSTTDQTAKTIVYLTPYNGDQVALYDGASAWSTVALTEKHIDLTEAQSGTTTNGNKIISGLTDTSQLIPGMLITGTNVGVASVIDTVDSATQVTGTVNSTGSATNTITFKVPASTVCDIFAYASGGAVKLELCKWTNDTTRATALAWQNGVYVKTGATTRRYMGSIRTTTTAGQTADALASRFCYNYYNRHKRPFFKSGYNSHAANTNYVYRYWNNDSTNIAEVLLGVGDVLEGAIWGHVLGGAGCTYGLFTFNADVANAFSNNFGLAGINSQSIGIYTGTAGEKYIDAGYHYVAILEMSAGANATWNEVYLNGSIQG